MDIREADDEDLLEELVHRGLIVDTRDIKKYSDTELNNELTRRQNEAMKRYNEMVEQGLV